MRSHKKLSPLFFSLACLALIIIPLFFVSPAKGVSYYNWVKGSEMETTTNYIEDAGFEANQFNAGVLYGNWSSPDAVTFESNPHSGVYNILLDNVESLWYNLTEPLLGADINEFSFWYVGIGQDQFDLTLYYSDYSTDSVNDYDTGEPATWNYVTDMLALIDGSKYLVAFKFYNDVTSDFRLDDFRLGVVDAYSQDQYDFYSYPWRTSGLASTWQQLGYNEYGLFGIIPLGTAPIGAIVDVDYIGHNLVWGRNSNGSGYIGYDESTAQFIQDIDYLETDSIHYIDLWAYTSSSDSVAVKVTLVYSDRTHDTKSVNITTTDTWEHLNYGSTWIDDGKYLIQIQINLANYFPAYVNIDDIGVWSELPSNAHRFTYSISPAPTQQSYIGFTAYQGVAHTFYGYVWDENQSLTESGTWSVITDYASSSGSIVDGAFSFVLNARSSSTDFSEQIRITLVIDDKVMVFDITATWKYTGQSTTPSGGNISTPMLNFFVMFFIIFVPPLGLAFEFSARKVNPMLGFIGGLVLVTAIGYLSSYTPVWFLFVSVLVTCLFMVAMLMGHFGVGGSSGGQPQ